MKESWYEKLNRWDEALEAYERKYRNASGTSAYVDAALGRLRYGPSHPVIRVGIPLLFCLPLLSSIPPWKPPPPVQSGSPGADIPMVLVTPECMHQ